MLLVLASSGFLALTRPAGAEAADMNKHMLWGMSGPNAGEVTLYWRHAENANNYHLVYGTEHGKFKYGATNIGWVNKYTVKKLLPNVTYHFALVPVKNDVALYTTDQAMAKAAGGVETMMVEKPQVSKPEAKVPVSTKQVVTGSVVGKQWLKAISGPKAGEVTLSWRHADSAENYHLVYGTAPGKYQYGALNIGLVNKMTVRSLVPGKTYYFALVPLVANVPLYTTGSVAAQAKSDVEIVQTTKEAVQQPKPKAVQKTVPIVQTPVEEPVVSAVPEVPSTGTAEPTTPSGY